MKQVSLVLGSIRRNDEPPGPAGSAIVSSVLRVCIFASIESCDEQDWLALASSLAWRHDRSGLGDESKTLPIDTNGQRVRRRSGQSLCRLTLEKLSSFKRDRNG